MEKNLTTGETTLKAAVSAIFIGFPGSRPTHQESQNAPTARIVNIRDIQNDALPENPEELPTVTLPPQVDTTKFKVRAGDVLIAARGLLKVASVSERLSGVLVAANLIVVRPGPRLAAPLVLEFLRHPETKQKLEQLRTGTTVPSLNVSAVAGLEVRIPSAAEQLKLAGLAQASERNFQAIMHAAAMRRQIAQTVLFAALGTK